MLAPVARMPSVAALVRNQLLSEYISANLTCMASINYDDKTALIVVDVQNDFADPAGSLYVQEGEDIVAPINDEIAASQAAGAFVVYTQDWHPPETPHFDTSGGIWPVHCVRDTWGAQLHPRLDVLGPVVRKGTGGEDGYSGFTMRDPVSDEQIATELHGRLQEHDIERVVVVGLALDVCVKATALDAKVLGYRLAVIADATRPVDLQPGDGLKALVELESAGAAVV
jgi:nicotinamidase/pyrazinamidase